MYISRAPGADTYNGTYVVQTHYEGDEIIGDEIVLLHTHELSLAPHVEQLHPSEAGFGESTGF